MNAHRVPAILTGISIALGVVALAIVLTRKDRVSVVIPDAVLELTELGDSATPANIVLPPRDESKRSEIAPSTTPATAPAEDSTTPSSPNQAASDDQARAYAEALLDEEEFASAVLSAQDSMLTVPAAIRLERSSLAKLRRSLVNASANRYKLLSALQNATPEMRAKMLVQARHSELLLSVLPELPRLVRSGQVAVSGAYLPRYKESDPSNIRGGIHIGFRRDGDGKSVMISARQGPWQTNLLVRQEAVHPEIWENYIRALRAGEPEKR